MKRILLLLVILATSQCLSAQQIDEGDSRAMIQANFIYQFAVNSNWPSEMKKGKFIIVVYGNEAVYKHVVEKYGMKPVGAQTIEVQAWSDYKPGTSSHIVFIDKSKRADLSKIMKEVKGKSTLVVTNWEGALGSGAAINFKTVDNSIRYELSEAALSEKKITPGNKILQWKVQ
ncbi:MAG: YfiR family protein [Sediminibacterium sp.]